MAARLVLSSFSSFFTFLICTIRVAREFPGSAVWQFLGFHTDHVPWVGCSFWDLIQPSFMFMVGVALPYSYASRKARGDSEARILAHTFLRALLLVLLGVFLTSA